MRSNFLAFDDVQLEDICIGFLFQSLLIFISSSSNTNSKKHFTSQKIQTLPLKLKSVGVNSKMPQNNQGIQTDLNDQIEEDLEVEYDEQSLKQFLLKTGPLMLDQLEANNQTALYDSPKHFLIFQLNFSIVYEGNEADQFGSSTQCIYTLTNKNNKLKEMELKLQITDIQWNSTGLICVASIGKFEHEGMCEDKSFIYAWNISKRGFQADVPSFVIDTAGCIMSLQFHPTKPSILAGGNFNGEIFLWDLSREDDPLISSSTIDDYFHTEAITQLMWMDQKKMGSLSLHFSLLSLSTDGKLLVWNTGEAETISNNQKALAYPIKGYSLIKKKDNVISNIGAMTFSQQSEDKETFILGTESGAIFRLKISNVSFDKKQKVLFDQSNQIKWTEESQFIMFNLNQKSIPDIKLHVEKYCYNEKITEILPEHIFRSKPEKKKMYPNPISFSYEPHFGPVYSISCSPFQRNLFITASLDGNIKFYDCLSNKSLLFLDHFNSYLYKIQWSTVRPGVFAACSSNGEVFIYDLLQSIKLPTFTLNYSDAFEISKKTLQENEVIEALNLCFNNSQPDLMACGFTGCQIKIFQLGKEYYMSSKGANQEINLMNSEIYQIENYK